MKLGTANAANATKTNANSSRSERRAQLISDILVRLHASGGGCQSCTGCTK